MSSLPASLFVNVTPNVLPAGGDAIALLGLMLTESSRVPIGEVLSFPNDGESVASYFGAGSTEAALAAIYFAGFDISTVKPNALLFAQYPETAVAAYLQGGRFGLTIAQMQALTGSLTVVMDGYAHVISSISLSSYNSFSAAAAAIGNAFTDPTEATFTASIGATGMGTAGSPSTQIALTSVTGLVSIGDTITASGIPANTTIVSQVSGSTGGNGTYVLSAANTTSSAPVTVTSNVLDVTADTDHAIAVGQTLVGSGVTGTPVITAQIGGTPGGIGTYRFSGAGQQVASESMTSIATAPVVTYDSVSGAFIVTSGITGAASSAAYATGSLAASLKLTAATGAILSQGAAATDPNTFMSAVVRQSQGWASFLTTFDPDGGSGNTQKQAFAAWANTQDKRYIYVCWDTDITPTESSDASSSLGQILKASNSDGTELINGNPTDGWSSTTGPQYAAFVAGMKASVDYNAVNGRITEAYKGQAGLVAVCTDATVYENLVANGYNSYVDIASATQQFVNYQPGSISGEFEWADDFDDQIWLNTGLQTDLMVLLTNVTSIPYNQAGYDLIRQACMTKINEALNNGVIKAGVTLSASQVAEINAAAGTTQAAGAVQTAGFYLQVVDAAPDVRQARGSPPINLWYTNGEAIQFLSLNSILVQ